MADKEEVPQTNSAEIESLIEQIRCASPEPATRVKIGRLLRTVLILVALPQRKNMSLNKLCNLTGGVARNARCGF